MRLSCKDCSTSCNISSCNISSCNMFTQKPNTAILNMYGFTKTMAINPNMLLCDVITIFQIAGLKNPVCNFSKTTMMSENAGTVERLTFELSHVEGCTAYYELT